jgi:hypothetical protein
MSASYCEIPAAGSNIRSGSIYKIIRGEDDHGPEKSWKVNHMQFSVAVRSVDSLERTSTFTPLTETRTICYKYREILRIFLLLIYNEFADIQKDQ